MAKADEMKDLPLTEDGDVDFDRVPEHLQELFDRSVTALNSIQKRSLHSLFHEFQDVFARDSKDIGKACGISQHINTGDGQPVHQRPRRYAKVHAENLQKQEGTCRRRHSSPEQQ